MQKPASLRAVLTAALPEYQRDPKNLVVFVDKGRLVSRGTAALGYEWRYTIRLEFHDCTSGPDQIAIPLLLWLREHQPERLLEFEREDNALGFAADILDDKSWDVAFAFELSEAVSVTPAAGGWQIVHHPEPVLEDSRPIGDGASLHDIWLGDTPIAGA